MISLPQRDDSKILSLLETLIQDVDLIKKALKIEPPAKHHAHRRKRRHRRNANPS